LDWGSFTSTRIRIFYNFMILEAYFTLYVYSFISAFIFVLVVSFVRVGISLFSS